MTVTKAFKSRAAFTLMLSCASMSSIALAVDDRLHDDLKETSYLNYSAPNVQQAIAEATEGAETQHEKAIAIHDYVRDQILFGFNRSFYNMSASEVLEAGKGFCNNQATLFAAMLRGAGIPARHRFFSLSAQVLNGIVNPGTDYVDHAVIEVYLSERWVSVDSYIVDSKYALAVQPKLSVDMGFGMRANASLSWDGQTQSYSQFDPSFVEREFGVFEDVGEFYRRAENPNNTLGFFEKLIFTLAVRSVNARIEDIRYGKVISKGDSIP